MLKMSEADRREAVCMLADSAGRVLARDFSSSTLADSHLLEKMSSAQVEALATVCRTKLAAGIEPTELEKQAFVGSLSGSAAVMKQMLQGGAKGWKSGFSLPTKLRGALRQGAAGRATATNVVERGEQAAMGSGLSRRAWSAMPETGMSPGAAAAPRAAAKAAPKAAPAATKAAPAATPAMRGTLGAAGRGAGWGGLTGAGVGGAGGAAVGAATAEEGQRMRGALIGAGIGATGGAALGAGGGAMLGAGRQAARNVSGASAQQAGQQVGQQAARQVPQSIGDEAAGEVAKKGLRPHHYALGTLGLAGTGTAGYFGVRHMLNRRQQLQQGVQQYPQQMAAPPAHYG